MDSPTLALTKQLIAKQSVTPMDEGCQVLMIEHLQKIGFEVESLRFGDVDNFWLSKVMQALFCALPAIQM